MHDMIQQLEDRALELLLAGNDPILDTLRSQLQYSTRKPRELTGAGFYRHFVVPSEAPRLLGNPSFELTDVFAEIEGLQFGAGFVLFIREGWLAWLEGCTYSETWPERISAFSVTYVKDGYPDEASERDLNALHRTRGWPGMTL